MTVIMHEVIKANYFYFTVSSNDSTVLSGKTFYTVAFIIQRKMEINCDREEKRDI